MTLRQFFAVVELRTKIVSVSTYALALTYALYRGAAVDPVKAALLFAATLAVDMGTTGFNSYFDWYRNVDDPRFNREEGKVIVHEGVSPGAALGASVLCYAAAAGLGLALALLMGPAWPWLLMAGAFCMLAGFLYSGGPRPLSSTPLGELFAGGFLGSALFLIGVSVLSGEIDGHAALASLPQALFIAAILSVNNACDFEGDSAAGRRTLAISLGRARAAWPVYAELAAGGLALAALGLAGVLPVWSAAAAVAGGSFAIPELRRMGRRGWSHDTKGPNMGGISRIFLLMSVAQLAGLAVGAFR